MSKLNGSLASIAWFFLELWAWVRIWIRVRVQVSWDKQIMMIISCLFGYILTIRSIMVDICCSKEGVFDSRATNEIIRKPLFLYSSFVGGIPSYTIQVDFFIILAKKILTLNMNIKRLSSSGYLSQWIWLL